MKKTKNFLAVIGSTVSETVGICGDHSPKEGSSRGLDIR